MNPHRPHGAAGWIPAAGAVLTAAAVSLAAAPSAGSPALSIDEIPLAVTGANEWLPDWRQTVAPLADGGYGVIWLEERRPGQALRMQWLASDGSPRFAAPGAEVGSARYLSVAAIVGCPTGGAFVAYDSSPGVGRTVYVQRFDARGDRRWPVGGLPVRELEGRQSQGRPTLAADGIGGVFVCYETCCFGDGVRCQRFDAEGRRLWSGYGVAVGKNSRQLRPVALTDRAGGLLVFWRSRVESLGGRRREVSLYGQRLSAEGARLWGDRQVEVRRILYRENASYDDRIFEAVPDGAGGAVLGFEDKLDRRGRWRHLGAQRVDPRGRLLWPVGTEVASGEKFWHLETVIGDGDGGAWLVGLRPLGSGSRLNLFRLGSDGRHLWREGGRLLSRRENKRSGNFLARGVLLDRVLWLGWSEVVRSSRSGYDDLSVKLARFSLDETRLDPQGGIPLGATRPQFVRAMASAVAGDSVLVIWQDRTKGNDDGDLGAALLRPPAR